MPQLTFSEKFDVLLANIMAYPLFLIMLGIPLIAFLINKTKFKKGILVYLIGATTILAININQIPILLDSLVEYIVNIMNFPTIGLILGIVIFEIIIVLMTFIRNYRNSVKIINSLGFIFVQILFGIALKIISKNDMNVSTVQNLSASLDLMVLLQMIMMIFGLQLGLLLINKLIDMVTNYLDNTAKEKVSVPVETIKTEKPIKVNYQDVLNPLKNALAISKQKVKNSSEIISNNIKNTSATITNNIKDKKQAISIERANKKAMKKDIVKKQVVETEPINQTLLNVTLEPENTNVVQTPEFTYGVVNPVRINDIKESEIEETPVLNNTKERHIEIAEIASKVDKIETSNRFITESTRKQMEEELLLYKEQLLIYRQEQLKKQEQLKRQEVDFNNIFNINYDDLKKSY